MKYIIAIAGILFSTASLAGVKLSGGQGGTIHNGTVNEPTFMASADGETVTLTSTETGIQRTFTWDETSQRYCIVYSETHVWDLWCLEFGEDPDEMISTILAVPLQPSVTVGPVTYD